MRQPYFEQVVKHEGVFKLEIPKNVFQYQNIIEEQVVIQVHWNTHTANIGERKIEPTDNGLKNQPVNEIKIGLVDFFIESTYTDSVRTFTRLCMPCLDITKYSQIALNTTEYNAFIDVL